MTPSGERNQKRISIIEMEPQIRAAATRAIRELIERRRLLEHSIAERNPASEKPEPRPRGN